MEHIHEKSEMSNRLRTASEAVNGKFGASRQISMGVPSVHNHFSRAAVDPAVFAAMSPDQKLISLNSSLNDVMNMLGHMLSTMNANTTAIRDLGRRLSVVEANLVQSRARDEDDDEDERSAASPVTEENDEKYPESLRVPTSISISNLSRPSSSTASALSFVFSDTPSVIIDDSDSTVSSSSASSSPCDADSSVSAPASAASFGMISRQSLDASALKSALMDFPVSQGCGIIPNHTPVEITPLNNHESFPDVQPADSVSESAAQAGTPAPTPAATSSSPLASAAAATLPEVSISLGARSASTVGPSVASPASTPISSSSSSSSAPLSGLPPPQLPGNMRRAVSVAAGSEKRGSASAPVPNMEMRGYLLKRGEDNKDTKRRWFQLHDSFRLAYFLSDPRQSGREPLGFVDLRSALQINKTISDDSNSQFEFGFSILSPDRIWYLYAPDYVSRSRWLDTLSAIIQPGPNMTVRHQGWLVKQGGLFKRWQKRWFVVGDDAVYYFENNVSSVNFVRLSLDSVSRMPSELLVLALGAIPLKGATIKQLASYDDQPHIIAIEQHHSKSERVYYFSAPTADEAMNWFEHLQGAVLTANASK